MPQVAMISVPLRGHYRSLFARLRDLGYSVVLVDEEPAPAIFDDVVVAHITVSKMDDRNVLEALREGRWAQALDGVLLFHELTVEISTRVAQALGLPHVAPDLASACVDKGEMRTLMRSRGVRCPKYVVAKSATEILDGAREIGYPVVVKPTRGGGSYGVTRLNDEGDATRFLSHLDIFWEPRRYVVEGYMAGSELSVETVTLADGTQVHLCAFVKPQDLSGPYFLEDTYVTAGWPPAGPEVDNVLEVVADMLRRLGLRRCITHTELRCTPDGPMVVEFGLRPIGWPGPLCVEAATGVDLVAVMAKLACDTQASLPQPVSNGAAGWRYLTVPKPGRVVAIPAPTSGAGTLGASTWVQPGDRVGVPPSDFNYIKGYLAVAADTTLDVIRQLDSAGWLMEVGED